MQLNFGSYVSLPTLFTCFLGFDVCTSLHLLSFVLKMFFLLFLFPLLFFSEWCEYFLYNHTFIKVCSSMNVRTSLCIYQLFMHFFPLQMMSILYFTYSSSSVCHCSQPFSIPMLIIVYTIIIIFIIIYKNVFAHKHCDYAYDFSPSMFRVHKYACVINYTSLIHL